MTSNKRRLVIEVKHCKECPFANKQQNEVIACWYPGKSDRMTTIGSGESIPDWCPLPVVEVDRVLACRLPQDSF